MTTTNIKLRSKVYFPATVVGDGGLTVDKKNAIFTVKPDFASLSTLNDLSSPGSLLTWVFDPTTGLYSNVLMAALITAATGSKIYTGSGAPSDATGVNGDLYVRTSNGALYQKASGTWGSSIGNITGPQGNTGATGATGPGYSATSATSQTISNSASQTFTVPAGLAYTVGARVRFTSAANTSNWMEGLVTAYSGTSMTVQMDKSNGSGAHADWNINIAGQPGAGDLSSANNGSDFASIPAVRVNLKIDGRTTSGDADKTWAASDGPVLATSAALTAPRTWTLPAANSVNAGEKRYIVDEAGGVSVTNTLTISRAGSDTIEGGTSLKLATPYGAIILVSDGASKWTKIGVSTFDQVSHRLGAETAIASASTTDIGSLPTSRVSITGTATITSLGSVANKMRLVRFTGALTLTHNGTSLVLPTAANIATAAGDSALFVSDASGNWVCLYYIPVSGLPLALATTAQFLANTSGKALSTDKVWAAAAEVALTDATTIAVDFSLGINFKVTLGGNRTLGAPSNMKEGQCGVIEILQDGTGSRTLAYNSAWKFAGGSAPTLSTAANALDLLFYQVKNGATTVFGSLQKGVA